MIRFFFLSLVFFSLAPAVSFALASTDGYISDVDTEISDEPVELVLVEKPEVLSGPTINEQVFNHQLSQEFTTRYEQTFGRTEQEDSYYLLDKQGYQFITTGVLSGTQLDKAREDFARYMAARLVEFHSDNMMKTSSTFKGVYQVKQAISKMNVSVNDSVKFDMNYSFVGNFANLKVTHPITNLLVTVNMNTASYVPTSPTELIVAQQKSWSKTFRDEIALYAYAKSLHLTVFKDLNQALSLNFTETLALVQNLVGGVDPSRESLSMAGMNLNF